MKIKRILLVQKNLTDDSFREYEMESAGGLHVKILSVGAALEEIHLPDKKSSSNILLTLRQQDYRKNPLYAGAALGPNAGRIRDALLPIEDKRYQLSANDGAHNLHGGFQNISFANWQEVSFRIEESCAVLTLSVRQKDLLDGYPGNRTINITYTLTEENTLTIEYQAFSDRDTYFNLSNHAYFNLGGDFNYSGLNQILQSDAAYYTFNNQEHICMGMLPVAHTPFDFRSPEQFLSKMKEYPGDDQLKNANGYNHALVLDPDALKEMKLAVTLISSDFSRRMKLYTDAPSIVLYSGGYIDETILLKDGLCGYPSCAIALEPQDIPNTPWVAPSAYKITKANELYTRKIVYQFEYSLC